MGIGVIDIDNHECMTLGSIQTPDCKTLDNMDKSLVDWYSSYLISRKDKLQSLSRTVVADAFFSKETFITPMCENDFHVISRSAFQTSGIRLGTAAMTTRGAKEDRIIN